MNNITKNLQNDIKSAMDSFAGIQRECKDIYDAYWKTDANSEISGLATGSTPATVSTKLTKDMYTNALSLMEDLNDFFQNGSLTTTDYMAYCEKVKYGDTAASSILSEATEALGDRIKQVCIDLITLYKSTKNIEKLYFDSGISTALSSLANDIIVFGSSMTKSELILAITFFQEFHNFMDNAAVTQGDYSATISKWKRIEEIA